MLKKVAVPFLAVVALVAVAGCAGQTSTAPSAAVGPPADVAGTWTGSTLVGGRDVVMVLEQTGANVKGNLRISGRPDEAIEGTVDANTIKLRQTSGMTSAPLLNVKGDHITGIVAGNNLDLKRSK